MASPKNDAVDGGKTEYKVLPLVISEEYSRLTPAKLSFWDANTRSWVQVLNENLGPSIDVRYAVRDSGIHIMAIQRFEDLGSDQQEKLPKTKFGRVSSLVFGKPPGAGPILYHVKKVPRDTRRPLEGKFLRLDFRILDGGLVFGVEIQKPGTSIVSAFADGAMLALKTMLHARTQILGFQSKGGSLWLRLESSQILGLKEEPLTVLWSSKAVWLGVNERVLPWIGTGGTQISNTPAEEAHSITTSKTQAPATSQSTENDSSPIEDIKVMPESALGKITPEILEITSVSNPSHSISSTKSSLEGVVSFYWESKIQNWTRVLPETVGTTFSLSLNFQLLPDGVEFCLLHEVPVPRFGPNPPGGRITQVLGSIKWYLGKKSANNIQYHIRMKEDEKGNQLPVFYFNLPELFEMKTPDKGGKIFDSMIDVAHQIFLETKNKTEAESFSNRWVCVKTSTTQNQAPVMEILQREDSPYLFCRSSAIPRRSRS
ncbi:hypothetical protein TWF481_007760 [Arthrobotrys musiformis]|uniref:Uncharacterized protein n=1 Tax=Arthrobotrys musiformis TaxID=47236 RepID=A0AAV9WDQ5_9PEZI